MQSMLRLIRIYLSAGIQKYASKRIEYEMEKMMAKSVHWVTVWHCSAEPRDAIQ